MWLSPPPVLVADLNRKVVFKCSTVEDDIPDDVDTADYVDCQEVWNKVEMNIIIKGLTTNTPEHLAIKPSTTN